MSRLALIIGGILSVLALPIWANSLVVDHQPAQTWFGKDPLLLNITVYSNSPVIAARLYYRVRGELTYTMVDLVSQSSTSFYGEIPTRYRKEEGVEYYVEFINQDQAKRTSPAFLAHLRPHEIQVTEDIGSDKITQILPAKSGVVRELKPLFVFNYNDDDDNPLDPESLIFYLDNVDVSRSVNRSYFTANFKPSRPLKKGKHVIKVYEKTDQGNELLLLSAFTIGTAKQSSWKGEVSHKVSRYRTSKSLSFTPAVDDQFNLKLDSKLEYFDIKGKVLMSARESDDQQPYNRYRADISNKDKNFFIKLGDINPVYSDYTINGIFSRGFELFYTNDRLDAKMNIGQTQRAISGGSGTDGTYGQNLFGVNLLWNLNNSLFLGSNFVHITDDERSIADIGSASNTPQENFLGSLNSKLLVNEGKTQVETELAASLFYRDKLTEVQDVDGIPQIVKDLVTLKAGTSADVAGRLKFRSPIWFNNIKGHVSYVGTGFNNLANSTLRADRQEAFVSNRVYIGTRALYVDGSAKYAQDNLRNIKTDTTTFTTLSVGGGIKFPFLPHVTGKVTLDDKVNDATSDTSKRDNRLINMNVAVRNLGVSLPGMKHSVGLTGSFTRFTDNTTAKLLPDFDSYSANGTWTVNLLKNWTVTGGGGINVKEDISTSVTTTYKTGSGKINLKWPRFHANTFLKGTGTLGSASNSSIDSRKLQVDTGLVWHPMDKHSLTAKLGVVQLEDFVDSANDFRDYSGSIQYKVTF